MGRIKYDIHIKPIQGTQFYQIRFTSQDALNEFTQIAVKKGIYKSGIVCHHLGEWKGIVNELCNSVQYGIWTNKYNVRIEYADNAHFEYGFTL